MQMPTGDSSKTPPGPNEAEIIRGLMTNAVAFYGEVAQKYGDVASLALGGNILFYFLSQPEQIKHVLQDNVKNYCKSPLWARLKSVVGEGLLTSEGDFWLGQRRMMQPFFHAQSLHEYGGVMSDCIAAMLARWEPLAAEHKPLDMVSEMMELTLEIIARVLLDADIDADGRREMLKSSTQTVYEQINRLYLDPSYSPDNPALPENRRYKEALAVLDRFIYESIAEHRANEKKSLLAKFIAARRKESGEGMTDRELRDEIITLLLAGHETTGNALAWTWYLLSQNPRVEAQLHAELAGALGGRRPAVDDLQKLPYTSLIFQEALRLYPPVWLIGRMTLGPDEIGRYPIPPGLTVNFSQYVTQRHPKLWDDPDAFVPERFSPEASAGRPKYAYFPFGGGGHQCIGNNFAMIEAQLTIATVAGRFKPRLVAGHPVEFQPLITLIPRHGMKMTLEPSL